jgi:hypothetical protein
MEAAMQRKIRAELAPWQTAAVYSPYQHTGFFGGVATGKSFSLAQFDVRMFLDRPEVPGFIGANTYDQLNQATLKELFFWLEEYGFDYVIHRKPPPSWGTPALNLPRYHNVLSVRVGKKRVANAFTRVLSKADALRGIQFGWYSLDETRDTPQDSHDVILSRMRRYPDPRGLVGTTTNGEDWGYKRFALARPGQRLYGSLHVPTTKSVELGIVSQQYLDTMLSSYSELMAQQEIYAMHVNVAGGRAYYSAGPWNRSVCSPWGDWVPDINRPLIVGCDFNFDPAPHIWMIGQVSPDGQSIHWFDELSRNRASTPEMAFLLISRYPGFFFRIYGDRSGARATTSNAGKHDYAQIAEVLTEHGSPFTLDSDQGNNPLVRNRVENMNRMLRDARGITRQTYNYVKCPHLDSDMKMVGWKPTTRKGQGALDDGGNKTLTHSSDGAGYAVWKIFPPGMGAMIVSPTESYSSTIMHS